MKEKKHYIGWGVAVFCTVCAILLFYDTLFGTRGLIRVGKQFMSAAAPVFYGAFMAYLLAPIVNFFELRPFSSSVPGQKGKQVSEKKGVSKLVRAISILLTWAVIGVLLYLLLQVLIPELYKSVVQLIANIETYYNTVSGWIRHLLETNPAVENWVGIQLETYYEMLESWAKKDLLPQVTTLMSVVSGGVFSGVFTVLGFFGDLLVGIIVSVYLLATKELCAAHARKVVYSLFRQEWVDLILQGAHKADRIFSGFVRGKLLDSLIIGILCFVGCTILKMPYTPLISLVVGVTNIIPFFGPFFGAIPSAFLILLASPLKAVYFVIFVLALQQLDGNVIGPKILGDKTGLSSMWVIFAILVGGSFFGVAGMFFGVPVCACLYSAVTFLVEVRLQKKQLPIDTEEYADQDKLKEIAAETSPQNGEKS